LRAKTKAFSCGTSPVDRVDRDHRSKFVFRGEIEREGVFTRSGRTLILPRAPQEIFSKKNASARRSNICAAQKEIAQNSFRRARTNRNHVETNLCRFAKFACHPQKTCRDSVMAKKTTKSTASKKPVKKAVATKKPAAKKK
jgi:hypothetical protein